jgi:hypothetical protein
MLKTNTWGKVIPTFTKKNSLFISFSDNGRDNEKVGITMCVFDTPKGCVGVPIA